MSALSNLVATIEKPTNLSIFLLTSWVLSEVFTQKSRGPATIGQYADTKLAYTEHQDFIETILLQISNPVTTRVLVESDDISNDQRENSVTLLFDYNLNSDEYVYRVTTIKLKGMWFVNSLHALLHLQEDLLNEKNHFLRGGYFCIVYTGHEANVLKTLRFIFERLFNNFVTNINVLIQSKDNILVYTYFPFTKTKCQNVDPYLYTVFGRSSNYKFTRKNFFPPKISNMWGCTVNITTWTQLPFINIKQNETTGDLVELGGYEGKFITMLSKHFNFTINIVDSPSRSVGNGTEPGSIKMLSDGATNISIGGLIYDRQRKIVAQSSYAYLHLPLNVVIPPGRLLTALERLVRPFKYIIWLCLSSSIIIGILVIYLLKAWCKRKLQAFVFGQRNRIPLTNLWSLLYGGPFMGALPHRNFARYILGVWLFYTLILRSAYLAQLFLILQDSQFRTELTTVDETLNQNFVFYADAATIPILTGAIRNKINIQLLDEKEHSVEALFKVLTETENPRIAVIILKPYIQKHNQDVNSFNREVNVLKEPMVNLPITLYMRKHSYLAYAIDNAVLNSMSAGLVSLFERNFWHQHASAIKEPDSADPIPLSLLLGLFYVYFVLILLTAIVFLLELLSKCSPSMKRFIDFLNY